MNTIQTARQLEEIGNLLHQIVGDHKGNDAEATKIMECRDRLWSLAEAAPCPAPAKPYDDMTDEERIEDANSRYSDVQLEEIERRMRQEPASQAASMLYVNGADLEVVRNKLGEIDGFVRVRDQPLPQEGWLEFTPATNPDDQTFEYRRGVAAALACIAARSGTMGNRSILREGSRLLLDIRASVDAAGAVRSFAQSILHGDDEHQDWLEEAAECFVNGQSMPEPRGKGTQTSAVSPRPNAIGP